MSDRAYEILGIATLCLALAFPIICFIIAVAFDWLDEKAQQIKRLFKKEKRPTRTRNRTVIRRTARRTTPTRTVRRRTA